jgi:hypothetical protein
MTAAAVYVGMDAMRNARRINAAPHEFADEFG